MINYIINSLLINVDKNNNGVDLSEYQDYLNNQKLPLSMADVFFQNFDLNNDGVLNRAELTSAYNSFDGSDGTKADGRLSFSESIIMQNALSDVQIDSTVKQSNYQAFVQNANKLFKSANQGTTGLDQLTAEEIKDYLSSSNYRYDDETVQNFINLFDSNKDGQVNILEYVKEYLSLDTTKDGTLDSTEADPINQVLKPLNQIEIASKDFIKAIDGITGEKDEDGNVIKDGIVSKEEFDAYAEKIGFSEDRAAKSFELFSKDGQISFDSLVTGYNSFDADGDGTLSFSEQLSIQNEITGINIDTTISSTQYNKLYSAASSFIKSADADNDGVVTVDEYANALFTNNYDKNDAAKVISYLNGNNGTDINVYQVVQKYIELDANDDGVLSSDTTATDGTVTEGENHPITSLVRKLSNVEIMAKNFVKTLDGITGEKDEDGNVIKDGVVSQDEYSQYLTNNYLPSSMATNLFNTYGTNGEISYEKLVSTYKSFDADNDGTLSFSEQIAFQNTTSNIKFDTNISKTQYSNLYSSAKTFMKMDDDKDGKVSVDELRAAFDTQNQSATNVNQLIPDGYAENLIVAFDQMQNGFAEDLAIDDLIEDPAATMQGGMAKDGAIDIYEYMQGMMKFDKNNDGKLGTAESLNFKEELYNTKLFEDVNQLFEDADFNSNKKLSAKELKAYFTMQGLSSSLAGKMIEAYDQGKYDLDGDGQLSRLEMMELYQQYDSNENLVLDVNEKLNLYNNIDGNRVSLDIDSANNKQYANMFESLQQYVLANDNNNDGLLSAEELKAYFKTQNLPDYLADSFIAKYDVASASDGVADGQLDLLELMKANIEFDADKSGDLDFAEQLQLDEKLTGLELGATEANKTQYTAIYNNALQTLKTYDVNSDNELDSNEIAKYLISKGLDGNYTNAFIAKNDLSISSNGSTDGKIDVLELTRAAIKFDANADGTLDPTEEAAFNENIKQGGNYIGAGITITDSNKIQVENLYNWAQSLMYYDTEGSDKKLSPVEMQNLFKSFAMPSYMASNFTKANDVNNDGAIDAAELTRGFLEIDNSGTSQDGSFDYLDWMKFWGTYANYSSGATENVTIDTNNIAQVHSLWDQVWTGVVANYDSDGNKELSNTEITSWFKSLGMSKDMAYRFVDIYANPDGQVDPLGLLNAYLYLDENKSSSIDTGEIINLIQKTSNLNLIDGYASTASLTNIYNQAGGVFSYETVDQDKQIDITEFNAYAQALGLTLTQAQNAFNKISSTGNIGMVNYATMMRTFENFDADKNGTIDGTEWNKMWAELGA